MTTTSNTTACKKVTLYDTSEADMYDRIRQIVKVHGHNGIPTWQKKVFFWIVNLESKLCKYFSSEDILFHADVYLPKK